MQIGRPTLIIGASLLLIAAAYLVNGAQNQHDGESGGSKSNFSRLFSSGESLEQRVQKLEEGLERTSRIQSELLDLVEDLHRRLEGYAPSLVETAAVDQPTGPRGVETEAYLNSREYYRQQRQMRLQRLIDAGINPDRAEFILQKQERFQYEHMKLAYKYRHLPDKSSPEAAALREQLSIYSHPRKMLEHELSEQEFELYLQASGSRQELRVGTVISDSPAANAGLQPGDKIISYNGERIFHMGDLRAQIYRVAPGQTVAVEIQRAGSSTREVIYVPSGPLGIQG